jgi:signal transduction histidine kinase
MRIRSRLLLLVSAVLLPGLVGAAIALAYIYREEHDFNHASMSETSRALALALDREMARREAILQTLADAQALHRGEMRRFYDHVSDVAKRTGSTIILSDLAGQQIVNTRLPFGVKLPVNLAIEREYRAAHGNEGTYISDLYMAPITHSGYNFAVEVPVRHDGRIVYLLSLTASSGQMQKVLSEGRLPPGWLATLIDRNGVVAARSMEHEKFAGSRVGRDLLDKVSASAQGVHEGVTLGGVPVTVFFSRAPTSQWTFLLSVPRSELYGGAYRATALLAAISLIMLALGLGAAFFVARRVSRPVESLREAAERLGRSEPVQAVAASGTLELDAVGQAMARASEQLRNATAELERRVAEAVASFEESQRALVQAQKLEALGLLTGGIAHDFNNVLQTLTATLQVLKLDTRGASRDLLGRCEQAVAHGTELARQLMAFGRVQEGRAEILDTAARLRDARQLLGGALPANVRFEYDLPERLWPVTVDPAQLELALLNLIMNARDALPTGGRIVLRGCNETVSAGRADLPPGEYIVLALSDNGIGMSEEVLSRALEPFYTTKPIGKGSGMGLPQAYGFARQNGGTLILDSRVGRGTTARMYLPRAVQGPAAAQRPPDAANMPAGKGRILLVEDDDHVRETMAVALRAVGFDIELAPTADEALARIEGGERYDAVLTDVVMPGAVSGLDLAAHLRRRHPRTGVVVVTGYSHRAAHLPGVRSLPKPYDLHQAVEALNASMSA